MITTAHADLWAPTPVNHSFEERDLGTDDNWSGSVLSWFDVDWTWEQTGTGLEGNGIPIPPDGLNWGGIGGTGVSYIYQQVGTYTGSIGMDIDFYIGLRSNTDNGPVRVSLWVGGNSDTAADYRTLDIDVGAEMVDSKTWTPEDLGSIDFGIVHVDGPLSIGPGYEDGAPVWLQFANLGTSGQMFIDYIHFLPPSQAFGPMPANRAINVRLDQTLSFNTGLAVDPEDPNAPYIVNPDITTHFVYMCKGDPEDPNLTLALAATLDVGTTSYDPEGQFELQRESVYRWRVDEGLGTDPNPDDPNAVITGPIWSFSTVGYTPYFNPDLPADAIVDAGEDVTFRVEATNPYTYDDTGLSYQWYKATIENPEGSPLACTEPNLAISDVQIADEGDYFCRVTIDNHPEDFADSARAVLAVKRPLAHWPFDDDPNTTTKSTEDIIGDADGVIIGNVVSGTGLMGNAFYFDAAEQMRIEIPTETINRRNWTLSFWAKIPSDNLNEGYNDIISNGPDREYPYGNFYLSAWPYLDEDEIVDFISVINNEGGEWSKILPKEVWQHLAVTYDTRTESHSYYINGGKMDEEDKSANPFTGFGPILSIGADADDAYTSPYTGWVDDLRLYSYPMEQQEITDLYLEGAGTEEECLAYWPLDNDPDNTDPNTSGIVEDVIGDADGVVVGDVEWGPGLAGNAAFFDGKKTRIELPTRTINRTSWSISFWINVPTSHVKEDYNDIISNGPYREDPWVYLYISGSIYPDEADFCSAINNAGDIWSWYYEKEIWHHLVTTYDPRTMIHTFYVNGAKIGDDFDMSRDPFLGFGPILSIGADADGSFSYAYSGWVDEVRFYSYPLRHSEVLDLYMTGLNLDEACINWEMPFYDMNDDCKIDMEDFAYISSVFSTDDEQADLSGNDIVDLADLVELAGMWLECGVYPMCAEPEQ